MQQVCVPTLSGVSSQPVPENPLSVPVPHKTSSCRPRPQELAYAYLHIVEIQVRSGTI